MENLILAEKKARKGKRHQYGVKIFDRDKEENLKKLQQSLINKTYRTSAYKIFTIHEPKERIIYKLPYFPDRICHHAVMNPLEHIFMKVFTQDTYSCIKKRGIHAALRKVRKVLKNKAETKYCLKLDIKKFYPSIDHEILKQLIRKKIKDKKLLWLLDEIIDSAPGLPIGNYLSQYLANFYLTYFDHWMKETERIKNYFRYADDMVILASNKLILHNLLRKIKDYLKTLKLEVKPNHQIFPVAERGIDFVGYVIFHTHTRLRKSIKQNFARMLKKSPTKHLLHLTRAGANGPTVLTLPINSSRHKKNETI